MAPDVSLDIVLSFPPGSVNGAVDCVTVIPIDDDVLEADEQFTVTLSSPTGGANLASPSMADVVILDNEGGEILYSARNIILWGLHSLNGRAFTFEHSYFVHTQFVFMTDFFYFNQCLFESGH